MKAKLLARLRQERPEAGETLLEVMISSALMGIIVVAVVSCFATILISSRVHRAQADGNVTLVDAMEQVRAPETARVCAPNNVSHPYRAALPSTITISSIEYQTTGTDAGGNPIVVWSSTDSACSLTSPLTLQRITLRYTSSAESSVTPSLSFVKGAY